MDFKDYIGKEMTEDERDKVNRELKVIFSRADIRRYMSDLHPEIFPRYVNVKFFSDNKPHWVSVGHESIVEGEYQPGWYSQDLRRGNPYVADVLAFYKDRDPRFHTFLTKVV